MNRNVLRAPLIKSATLLVVVSLLVYLTATSPEGSIWGSLGTLFMASFRIVQLGLGLIISLLFCLAVLTGIFLGCVAMVSRESAANMFDQLRQTISENLLYVRSLVIRDMPSLGARILKDHGSEVKKELTVEMEGSLETIRQDHSIATKKVDDVMQRLERVENGGEMAAAISRLDEHEERMHQANAANKAVNDQIAALQESVRELSGHSHEKQEDPVLTGMSSRLDLIEKSVAALQESLASLQNDLNTVLEAAGESDGSGSEEAIEHRLFSHLENQKMQAKVEELVTETLDKDMTYAQVIDHLVKHTKGKAAESIAAHPSLAKDYIRFRRNNG